jgi:hypothetical protein
MDFRRLRAQDLDGSTELPKFQDWIANITPEDTVLLITAPAGTGKAAAVGAIARRTEREVVLCNLMQVLDYEDSEHQLENLLRACEAHSQVVVYLDKIDKLIAEWSRKHPDNPQHLSERLTAWISEHRPRFREHNSTLVFTGRLADQIPSEFQQVVDKSLMVSQR